MFRPLAKILVIEDSPDIRALVTTSLSATFAVRTVSFRSDAIKLIEEEDFDLLIMDVQLPDGDGFQLCAELKNKGWKGKPVIFLTAKTSIEDKILAFAVGADDYLVKPFDHRELLARVQAKFRVIEGVRRGTKVGDLWLDFERQAAFIVKDDSEVRLTLTITEFKLLSCLAQSPNSVLNRDRILDFVWGPTHYLCDRSVDVYISSLRRKIKNASCRIKTIYKAGYILTVDKNDQSESNS
jgi:DNA-binding response OmpR family regulator